MNDKKADIQAAATASKLIASVDVVIACLCAANGNSYFAGFMVLAGIMWAYSVYMQAKADEMEE